MLLIIRLLVCRPWIQWAEWAEYYKNPLTTIWVGREPRIIVQDAWVASDLLEKRADIFSSRPRFVVMGDVIDATTTNQTTLVYGDRWRVHRKLMTNDEVAQLALAVMEAVNYVVPGYFLMEAVPFLAKLPSWIYSTPSKIGKGAALFSQYFYLLTQEGANAKVPTFGKTLLKAQPEFNLSDKEVSTLASNLIGGGVDTTSSTMLSFILAMAYFPDVQKKLQAELDEVLGDNRSQTWDDVDHNLPYLIATVKEILRWRSVTVLAGIPHANTVDYEYKGYFIPAGTNITGNLWAIHRNPRDFPDPDVVRPERFLNGLENAYPNQRGSNPFGYGRRQCSGQPLAEQGLYYSLGRIAWAFNIEPGLDENGNEVKLDIFAFTNTENMRPEPFKVRLSPRTPKIKEMILAEAQTARDELRIYDIETKVTIKEALQAA
ncbi:cytochrome P450 [Clohesyomyces aquaticus]|uniref:Cytochrome P450 n=1 Tax=Clohesyomyces aquaticus TaxID=1231657 RepID=A0A1Y1ZU66_9PLEO|nr:cytochrome P450 [Clohesyomyces aquaticus]